MIRALGWAAMLAMLASSARAQLTPDARSPLDRRVTLRLRDVALRVALDRIALAARIQLSYSGDNLPLDARVSVAKDSTAVGEMLRELVGAFGVRAEAVDSNQVVLVRWISSRTDTTPRSVAVLDRVVVTGSVGGGPARALPLALAYISGRDLERRQERTVSQILSGAVPGLWVWEQTPTSLLARYGSIRGASSFSVSSPKVYVDGIEVANPLLFTQISPELVERIEVIRGPQGAALYGSDAISGVVNIVSRHEGVQPGESRATVRSSAGVVASSFSTGTVPIQHHALSVRMGSNLRSAGLSVGGSTSGQYVPDAFSRDLRALADARVIGHRTSFTAIARGYLKDAAIGGSPLLGGPPDEDKSDPQQLRMFTLGSTATIAASPWWTYALTAGIDGYTLRHVAIEDAAIPSVADSALQNASGSAMRGTLRASVSTRRGTERMGGTLTLAIEETLLRDGTGNPESGSSAGSGTDHESLWSSSTGLVAHGSLELLDAVFFTGGLRRERIGSEDASRFVTLPMAGVAIGRDMGTVAWKLRGAYGRGVRAAHSATQLLVARPKRSVANPTLQPEQQEGVEAGADLVLWRRLGVQVTGFDQLASSLIQTVTIPDPDNGGSVSRRSWYQLQNVGEIRNRGWEAQATLQLGPASLAGAATLVDSRVQRVAAAYTGDLRPGDRMLAVPARTLSGSAGWTRGRINASTTIARASDWINYDRLAIASQLIAARGDTAFTGADLRQFWLRYPGATRLAATLNVEARRGLLLTIAGENLLNNERGEPDSITILPGRTVTAGLRARF